MSKEIELVACERCGGTGKVPAASTGMILRAERERAGVTLAAVASDMDISTAYLGDMERGNRDWNNRRVEQFRAAIRLRRP